MSPHTGAFTSGLPSSRSPLGAVLLSLALHGMLWLAWRERSKLPEPPVEPPRVIEVALIAAQRQAAPELPKASPPPPPPVQKPEPKPDKPLPKKPEKPKPKPKPTPKPLPELVPEPRPELPDKTDPAPAPSPPVTTASPPVQGKPVAPSAPTASLVEATFKAPGLHNPPTRYPRLALERQWEGRVVLRVQVHADGSPGDIRVEKSSGHELLDEAAVSQVGQWRFLPARRGDQAVASSVLVPIEFKLKR